MTTVCDVLKISADPELCRRVLDADEQLFVTKAAAEIGHFSTFSGFLAALAFASLMILVTNPPKAERGNEPFMISIFSLIVVLALLLLSTFMFIPMTGSVFRPQQEIGFLISNTILAVAVSELFLSLSWFFAAYRLAPETRRAAVVTFYFVTVVIALNMAAGLANISESLRHYYPDEITRISSIKDYLFKVSGPIILAFVIRGTIRDRFSDEFWRSLTRIIIYGSLAFSIILIAAYVHLFSGRWVMTALPFPHGSSDALAVGLGFVLASCVLALPRPDRKA